tara:strand:+ start:443 stop:784 length:342 start_codon:yes stop_codon:yes gene_type:complete
MKLIEDWEKNNIMIKLTNLLNESSPGFENRQTGDALPTLDSVRAAYQAKQGITEAGVDKKVQKIADGVVGAVKLDLEHIKSSIKEDGIEEAKDYCRYAIDRLKQLQVVLKRIK